MSYLLLNQLADWSTHLSAPRSGSVAAVVVGRRRHGEELGSAETAQSPLSVELDERSAVGVVSQRRAVSGVAVMRRMLARQLTQPVPRRRRRHRHDVAAAAAAARR